MVSHLGVAVDVELDGGEATRLRVQRKSGIVVGDDIEVDGERAVQLPRRTALLRRSPGGGVHVVAANLDVVGIVAAVDPPARAGLIDRAAVAAWSAGIEPFLIVNKVDLDGAAEIVEAAVGRVAGEMRTFAVSAVNGEGVDAIAAFLAERGRGALIGPSGVGKSSLLNRLMPGLELKVRTLSEANGVGRHTTTVSTLHRLPGGGELVDTPGVREFGLVDVEPRDLARWFPGFSVVTEACRFRDCMHKDEPGCAIVQAVDDDIVDAGRYIAYRNLLGELGEA
ncbi:MAG TPA: ribosome small subunit-dependent GTPase A [Myxococcota bacterium]